MGAPGLRLSFLGAAGTVTGSRFLLDTGGSRILVDCGLFQGLKNHRLRNRAPFPVPPESIDAVVLSHAHIDHTGYLPVLVRDGLSAPIVATPGSADLAKVLLPDSGHLQEEEAENANRHGWSRHRPALPLYTRADGVAAAARIEPLAFETERMLPGGVSLRFRRNGHILGSASVVLTVGDTRVVFSGDVGHDADPLMPAPTPVEHADWLVMESTYGNRRHPDTDPAQALAEIVRDTAARGGTLLIPAFAVGRAQTLLLLLGRLRAEGRIPELPTFLDSPMARDVTDLVARHADEFRVSADDWHRLTKHVTITNSVDESKAIDQRIGPSIVISASGMATGGRVIHHLKTFAPHHRNTILFAGFQAAGTRGQALVDGARTVRIHGADHPVRASVRSLSSLSAHADADGLLRWLTHFVTPPRETFLTHGEPLAADELRKSIERRLGWRVRVPEHLESADLGRPRGPADVVPKAVRALQIGP